MFNFLYDTQGSFIHPFKQASMKLLIVDDSKFMRQAIETELEHLGLEISHAESGEDGLKMALSELPDLILLDVRMPGIDGFETCRRMREFESLKDVPIIMVAVESDVGSVRKAIQAGASDYIRKPIDYEELVQRIDQYMTLD
jgi:CheY-like chemotaxis protein